MLTVLTLSSCTQQPIPTVYISEPNRVEFIKKVACTVEYHDSANSLKTDARIKWRGGHSRRYYKRSYTLTLAKKQALAGMPASKYWVLNANYIDKTFMRHTISFDLYRSMGSHAIAPQTAYINVYYNNSYKGVYVLMQKLQEHTLKLNRKDTMAMVFKEPPIFFKERLAYVRDSQNYYGQRYPKITTSNKEYYITQLHDFLYNSSDSLFARTIHEWFDIKTVIDWHIMLLFTNNSDGILKNFYLYKQSASQPFRIAIWDYDHSYGRDGDNEPNMMEREIDCKRSILIKRLMENPQTNYVHSLKRRWQELQEQNILTYENFDAHINRNHQIINKYVRANFDVWPVDSEFYFDAQTYEEELQLMRQFVKLRIEYLQSYFSSL